MAAVEEGHTSTGSQWVNQFDLSSGSSKTLTLLPLFGAVFIKSTSGIPVVQCATAPIESATASW